MKINIKKDKCRLLSLLILGTCMQAYAQDSIQPISLEVVLQLGGANNLTIQEYKQRQELAMADVAKAREWWLPDVYAGIATEQLWGAVMNGNGRFFLDVSRNNLWTGMGLDARWDFSKGIFQTRSAKLLAEAARFKTQAERNTQLLESINAYYDFLAAQLYYKAYEQLSAQADTIAQQIAIQVQAGIRYTSESLLAQSNVQHIKVEMLNSRTEHMKKAAALVRLLHLPPGVKLVAVDTLLAPLSLGKDQEGWGGPEAAYSNKPEIKELELRVKALETEKKTITTGLLLPQLHVGTYGSYFGRLSGKVTPMDPVTYPKTNMLYPTGVLNISLMWRIPLGRFIQAGDLKQYDANIRIQQTQIEQEKAKVNEAFIASREQLIVARQQMQVAEEGSRLAAEALTQSIQRQALGTALPFEILQAQEIFITARLDYLRAVATYNKAQYALHVAAGNNL